MIQKQQKNGIFVENVKHNFSAITIIHQHRQTLPCIQSNLTITHKQGVSKPAYNEQSIKYNKYDIYTVGWVTDG